MSKFELVIFDCDGVLVDSEEMVNDLFYAKVCTLGFNMPKAEFLKICLGRTLTEDLEFVAKTTGSQIPANFIEEYREERNEMLKQNVTAIPGIKEVLEEIKIKKCVASNGEYQKMHITLNATGLAGHFNDNIFSASEVSRGKPNPDLFLFAANKMGVEASKCLVVEDSLSGIKAGIAAGMTVVHYRGYATEKCNLENVHEIHQMKDLLTFL